MVIWITGLPSSGKTTLAQQLVILFEKNRIPCEHIDSDQIRKVFSNTGYSKSARNEHTKMVGYWASRLEHFGVVPIVSLISPYEESRNYARRACSDFFEIHLTTALTVCESRDPKGLYKKARNGEIREFTGISAPYEAPTNAELELDTGTLSICDSTRLIVNHLNTRSGKYLWNSCLK